MMYYTGLLRRALFGSTVALALLATRGATGADPPQSPEKTPTAVEPAPAAVPEPAASEPRKAEGEPLTLKPAPPPEVPPVDIWELVKAGGVELAAIVAVSVLSLAFAAERFLALRRRRVVPRELVSGLRSLAAQKGGLDPRLAYKLCQEHPSTAAVVMKAVLEKTGRPNNELEQALAEASEREATRLYANVRWQTLTFNVAPMLGLLGTIQGVIVAFHTTSYMASGANKATSMAEGIYRALVNTFAGLAVAIPAAIFAHFLEGRVIKLMAEVDDFVRGLLPQLERLEGRVRVTTEAGEKGDGAARLSVVEENKVKQPAARPQ